MPRYLKLLLAGSAASVLLFALLVVWVSEKDDATLSKGYMVLASQQEAAGQLDEALHLYHTSSVFDPSNADPLYRIGLIHLHGKRLDSAAYFLNAAYELDPGRYDACFQLGVMYYYHYKDKSRSVLWLERSVANNPSYKPAGDLLAAARSLPDDE